MHAASWRAAEMLLWEARTWIFVGYSMPAADYEFKQMLKQVQLSRRTKPEILLITGGSAAADTAMTYRRFFGANSINDDDIIPDGFGARALARLRLRGAVL